MEEARQLTRSEMVAEIEKLLSEASYKQTALVYSFLKSLLKKVSK